MLPKSRLVPVFILALGVALLVAGILLPRLMADPDRVPLDLSATTITLTDDDGSYLSPAQENAEPRHTPITRQIHVELVPPATDDTVTARIGYSTVEGEKAPSANDRSDTDHSLDQLIKAEVWSGTFDRVSGLAQGSGTVATQYAAPPVNVDLEGSWLKFPARMDKQSYLYFDPQLRGAYEATFMGEETIDDLPVYVYEQKIAPTNVAKHYADPLGTTDVEIDGQRQRAFYFHGATRKLWVEPESGMIVKLNESVNDFYGLNDGKEVRPFLRFDGKMDPEDVATKVAQAKTITEQSDPRAWSLALIVLGGIVTIIAAVLALRPRRHQPDRKGPTEK